jgi:cytochrome b involved in lipid metabolism
MGVQAEHPGGRAVIEGYSGKDASSAFRNVPHSPAAEALLEGLKVGDLMEVVPHQLWRCMFQH